MQFYRYLLFPFSVLYGVAVRVRNRMYDWDIKSSKSFEIPVVGIGNLSAGGTGKTPMAEYLLRFLLDKGFKPAMLSRGYKRQSTGFHIVKPYSTAARVGDEPYQVKRKLPEAVVAVCEDRALGIETLKATVPGIDIIVLDDSYQHRKVTPGFNILLTDYNKPFYDDLLLPAGMLREPRKGKSRADVIIVTKCPSKLDAREKNLIKSKISPHENQDVFFTSITYQSLVKCEGAENETFEVENLRGYEVLLFTGIAKTGPLVNYLKHQQIDAELMAFADHHTFTAGDIQKIKARWNAINKLNKILLTTEKDWRRLENTEEAKLLTGIPLYYLPVQVGWAADEKNEFEAKILEYVKRTP